MIKGDGIGLLLDLPEAAVSGLDTLQRVLFAHRLWKKFRRRYLGDVSTKKNESQGSRYTRTRRELDRAHKVSMFGQL